MFRSPAFKAHLHVAIASPELVVVVRGEEALRFEGRLLPLLVPWIDGEHSVAAIVDQLRGQATAIDVRFGLSLLADAKVLIEASSRLPPEILPLADRGAEDAHDAGERLESTRIGVLGVGDVDVEGLKASLTALHLQSGEEGNFQIVLVEDPASPELEKVNRDALADGRAWLMLHLASDGLWLGPAFHPGRTACWACLSQRLRENRPDLGGQAAFVLRPPDSPALRESSLRIASLEILRWVVEDGLPELENGLVTFDLWTATSRRHAVARLPHCPACGSDATALSLPHRELPREGCIVSRDGGYRTAHPEETLGSLAHLISPLTGVVARLAARDTKGVGEVAVADHLFRSEGSALRRLSAGKGLGSTQSRASALCEALERYCGVFRGDETRHRATLDRLEGRAIHPVSHLNFSPRQYRDREQWNRLEAPYLAVPAPFDPAREVDWTPLWSLTRKETVYLPTRLCYYDAPIDPDHDFGRADSNGQAAGNRWDEAVLQGLLELVERDAVALWWYSRCRRPGVELGSFGDSRLDELVVGHRRLGRELAVLDLTHDLAIPAFAAVSRGPGGPLLGFGAHLDAGIAVARAVTEMNQFLPGRLAGSDRRLFAGELADDRFLLPDRSATKARGDFAPASFEEVGEALAHTLRLVEVRGLEVLVLDQTRADVGLPVVKVVVPGLRHYWARLAPGRLYDVPPRIGWIEQALREEELNPCHLLI